MKKHTIPAIMIGFLFPLAQSATAALTAMSSVIEQGVDGPLSRYVVNSALSKEGFLTAGISASSITPLSLGSTFSISLNFDASVTPAQQVIFNQAKATWQSLISAYQTGVTGPTTLVINASVPVIDGPGGVLGSAGPTTGILSGGYFLSNSGTMQFDSADVANLIADGVFDEVILHEMGHVLGLGTLWSANGLYTAGSGQYTGPAGLAAFKTEWAGQSAATFVPVELGGGLGTADGHWNEVDSGAGATGLTRLVGGEDMQFELMTGWLNTSQPNFISKLTLGSLIDLGYATVPEPSSGSFLLLLTLGLMGRRRRR